MIFIEALKLYFGHGSLEEKGLPSVDVLADKLSLSTRYLSDLLKMLHTYQVVQKANGANSLEYRKVLLN